MDKECLYCGKLFTPQRSTAKFDSDECRVRYHRMKKRNISTPTAIAFEQIRSIMAGIDDPDLSYEATSALLSLQTMLNYAIPRHDSWWRCQKCKTAVRKQIPDDGDCPCEKPHWRLQRT